MPTISTISPSTFDDGKPVTLTGSGFGSSQGQVLIGGVAQNVNTWSDTGITFTTVRGSQSLGACRVDVVKGAGGVLLYSADFETGALPSGWTLETNGSGSADYPSSGAHSGGYAFRASMIAAGGVQQALRRSVASYNTRQIYIDFWAKMPTTQKQGCKFVKVFGKNAGGYANCTFGMTYAGTAGDGTLQEVSFGDGTDTSNDTQNTIRYSSGGTIGRSPSPTILRPMGAVFSPSDWGTDWHHFRLMVKFNSGSTAENEVADGEFYVEIDGNVYLNATGLFNRHYSNGTIDFISFIDFTTNVDAPYEVWLDDIKISTGGFV